MSDRVKPNVSDKTTNWKGCKAALKSCGALLIWLDPHLLRHLSLTGKRGRSPTFSDAAIQFYLTIKCLLGLALRQTLGMRVKATLWIVSLSRDQGLLIAAWEMG